MTSVLTFTLASLALAITPGPGVLYIVSGTLAQGRRAGLASVAGVALGNLGNAAAASLGLAALFAAWPPAWRLVCIAGGAYLVWLGIAALRAPPPVAGAAAPSGQWLRQGFVVALLNPKTALFFAAFLPPFLDPAGSAIVQSLALGALFVAIAALTDSAWVLAAAAAAPRLAGGARDGRWVAAAVYVGLGLWAAWSGLAVA
jgi:threonine/homoserine/homoserine lactone efflux protein